MIDQFNKLIIKHFQPYKDHHPVRPKVYHFTTGLCWYWAYVFVQVHGGAFVNLGNQHMMVEWFDGRYYDAEHPEGLEKLPDSFGSKVITWQETYYDIETAKEGFYYNDEITNIYDKVAEKVFKDTFR